MKYLKTIDFVGQTVILGGYGIVMGWTLINNPVEKEFGLTSAFAMLCLGWWQMISASLMLLLSAPNRKFRLYHFFIAVGYLASLAIMTKYLSLPTTQIMALDHLIRLSITVIALAMPATLGLFYYYITWRWVFPLKPSGKFLPHISF